MASLVALALHVFLIAAFMPSMCGILGKPLIASMAAYVAGRCYQKWRGQVFSHGESDLKEVWGGSGGIWGGSKFFSIRLWLSSQMIRVCAESAQRESAQSWLNQHWSSLCFFERTLHSNSPSCLYCWNMERENLTSTPGLLCMVFLLWMDHFPPVSLGWWVYRSVFQNTITLIHRPVLLKCGPFKDVWASIPSMLGGEFWLLKPTQLKKTAIFEKHWAVIILPNLQQFWMVHIWKYWES